VFLWYFYKMIKQKRDVYFLKQENFVIATFGIICWIIYLILGFSVPTTLVFNNVLRFYFVVMHFVIIDFPLIQTFRPPVLLSKKITNLSQIFEQKVLKEMFREFLVKSLAIENYLFYEDVTNLLTENNLQTQIKTALQIRAKYIVDDSPFQVNLDYKLSKSIQESLDENLVSKLNVAYTAIFDILREDSYPRFLQSVEFKYWEAYEKEMKETLNDSKINLY